MFLLFPQMHPELLVSSTRDVLPEGVRFLDPGLGAVSGAEHVRPEQAPFDVRTAKALLADTLRFGESQAHPGDLLAQSLIERVGALSPESSRAVQGEVEKSILGVPSAAGSAAPMDAARRQAQMLLLLAWSLEERMLELRGVEGRLQSAWERLGQSVAADPAPDGIEAAECETVETDDEQEALAFKRDLSGLTPPEASAVSMPWRKLLESYAVLMPGQALCTVEPEIGAALAEDGIPEAPLDAMPGALRVFRAQAWRFAGHAAPVRDKPWLDEMLTVGVYASATGKK